MIDVAANLEDIEKQVMAGLKEFQCATVNRIDELFRSNQMRILVSDEVGMGKTLVARGVVAKLACMRKEQNDDLVKVVYVCSNATIADQNLSKLQINKDIRRERASASRLSMQHLNIFTQENDPNLWKQYIQLIPLTPETSFRVSGTRTGTASERALMWAVLSATKIFKGFEEELSELLRGSGIKYWKWYKDEEAARVEKCDADSKMIKKEGETYLKYMENALRKELALKCDSDEEKDQTWQEKLQQLLHDVAHGDLDNEERKKMIGHLRAMFARISLDKLEPDLVIMDEFQRFKYLLESEGQETEMGILTKKFFNEDKVRVLLLSATPYKMYSTLDEIDNNYVEKNCNFAEADEHFSEFFKVVNFLKTSREEQEDFKTVWSDYSKQLKEASHGKTTILVAKEKAENALYDNVCRTERITDKSVVDMIDDSDVKKHVEIDVNDVKSYIQAEKIVDFMRTHSKAKDDIRNSRTYVPIDYVKSSPYLMSFMNDYKLKTNITNYFKKHKNDVEQVKGDSLWLDRNKINNYEEIPCANGRLKRVMEHVLKDNAELLLWIPPCKPYYAPEGVFAGVKDFTKTLVFSSWEMVPRMLTSLISYEVERRTVGKLAVEHNANAKYFYKKGQGYPRGKLRFRMNNGSVAAMSLFCLLYPSSFLANSYDPIDCLNRKLRLENIREEIKAKITDRLSVFKTVESERKDQRWYYMAPLLLDIKGDLSKKNNGGVQFNFRDNDVVAWFEQVMDKDGEGPVDNIESDGVLRNTVYNKHVKELKKLYTEVKENDNGILGPMPEDLLEVLADIAIASPAVCAYRVFKKYNKKQISTNMSYGTEIARIFIDRMNMPTSTAVVDLACGGSEEVDVYWRKVLKYAEDGNFQAMLDEYAHLLSTGIDDNDAFMEQLYNSLKDNMTLRTTRYKFDTYEQFVGKITGELPDELQSEQNSFRTHFAAAFVDGDNDEKDTNRKKNLRNVFNSPFRPFVLASTSIGQEGLDFHNYCRRIVHWNLPSNPIDLEQREGRINRFECLVIRQNIVKRYGDGISFKNDVWQEMFKEAEGKEKGYVESGLIPYWCLTAGEHPEEMVKIERIVPIYPFSKDEQSYERLIKILSTYRLTLGQPRQEELIEAFLHNKKENLNEVKKLFLNLSPYYRGRI